jgi:AcrR family transcriptional regulator
MSHSDIATIAPMAQCVIGYDRPMPRWEPDTQDRLKRAAFELFASRGYQETTVEAIAERAGVSRRTFHRWFPDKREVLFAGEELIGERVAAIVADGPPGPPSVDTIAAGIAAIGEQVFEGRRDELRIRNAIIAADPDLGERDLRKVDLLHDAIARAYVGAGAEPLDADVTAGIGVALFRATLHRWFAADDPSFADAAREVRATFRRVTG